MTDEPTPTPGPVASRYGLVRPQQGRYVAGVCAAIGRATNTDPVLWRVVLAVLVCFGGIGGLAYLGLWLLTPEEGDTASPAEALLGRGHSRTSPALTVGLAVISALLLWWVLSRPLYILLLGGTVVLLAVLLTNSRSWSTTASATPTTPTAAAAASNRPPANWDEPWPEPAIPWHEPATPPAAADHEANAAESAPIGQPAAGGAGYRPPFAPYGPFGGPPPPPAPPPPPRERSPLTTITLFTTLGLLGGLGILHLTGVLAVPVLGYPIAGLMVVGLGLLLGAWLGRARSLIAVGLVLLLSLPVVHVAETWQPRGPVGASITWTPTSHAELDDYYELTFGEGVIDLRGLDFSDEPGELTIQATGADIWVLVPETVTVTADAQVFAGQARVLGEDVAGLSASQSITSTELEGPAGGQLSLTLTARFGNIEVTR